MKTLAAVYWMIDGVSWLCHVVADLTCSSFILLTSCILALPTYRLLGWSSWRWCMVFQQNHDSTLTDALCGRWLTMVFGHCLGSCRTNALSVAEKTRVFSLGQTLESPASPRYSLPGKCPQMKFFDAWLGGSCQLTTSRWCAIQQWDNYINMNPTRGIHFFESSKNSIVCSCLFTGVISWIRPFWFSPRSMEWGPRKRPTRALRATDCSASRISPEVRRKQRGFVVVVGWTTQYIL